MPTSTNDLVELLRVLREHGVTKYTTPELSLELGSATFAASPAPALTEVNTDLNDVEKALTGLAATRAIDALPPHYRELMLGHK